MKDETHNTAEHSLNLNELTDFQFGPAWARGGTESSPSYENIHRGEQRRAPRRDDARRPRNDRRRDAQSDGAPRNDRRGRNFRRDDDRRRPQPQRELPKPAEGFRVELRPANSVLELVSSEIRKQKRALPLMDLARMVVGAKNRYDLVLMKLENGPTILHSTKGDNACWLTREEAMEYMHKAPWFKDFYTAEQIEVEAPKGSFTAIAVCGLGKELIGPANWHGYQSALVQLHRSKYSNMPLDAFKNRITMDKSEETVAAWMESASHKTIWKPVREGAEDIVLEDSRAIEADFAEHHFSTVYEETDKIFINGAVDTSLISAGLAAHVIQMADKTRKFPQMLIPNLCHGLARHHMPIYKWHGNHFTGPSRVRAIPADMELADRMKAIVEWSKAHSGQKAEEMFAELSGVPGGETEEEKQAATEAHAPYVADMIWLLEQGYIVVTGDNAVWYPKGEHAPEPTKAPQKNKRHKKTTKPHSAE